MSAKYPKTCKAAVLPAQREKLVIKDIEVKEPQAGEILIKVHACGVCHSDSLVIGGGMGSMYATTLVLIMNWLSNDDTAHTTISFSATKLSAPSLLSVLGRRNGKKVIALAGRGMAVMMAHARVATGVFSSCVIMRLSMV
jgi:hypothetical protein